MLVPTNMIPDDIFNEYKLSKLAQNGKVLVEIRKGMYGLPQAGRIAYDKLLTHLARGGYVPAGTTPGLFKHTSKPLIFCLVIDDFGVKYSNCKDATDLITHLEKVYKIVMNWNGDVFCGIRLQWDYRKRTVYLNMPKTVP